jgi:hypothetical protein
LVLQKYIKTLFKKIILTITQKGFNSLWIFNQHKQFIQFDFFLHSKFLKNLGCYRLPPLKGISSRDLESLERKMDLGYLGGLPPLKEKKSVVLVWFILGSLGYSLALSHLLNHIWLLTSFPIGGNTSHMLTY